MMEDAAVLAWMMAHAHECEVGGVVQTNELAEYAWNESGQWSGGEWRMTYIKVRPGEPLVHIPVRFVRLARQAAGEPGRWADDH